MSSFSRRRYIPFILGHLSSNVGTAAGMMAFTLAVLERDGLSNHLGEFLAARAVPALLFLPLAGTLVARIPVRPLLIGLETTRVIGTGMLALLMMGSVVQPLSVTVVCCVLGTMDAISLPAQGQYVRDVSDHVREWINAILAATLAGARIVGTSAAGALSIVLPAHAVLLVCASGSVVSAIALARSPAPQQSSSSESVDNFTGRFTRGWTVLRSNRWALAICVQTSLFNLLAWSPYYAIAPRLIDSAYNSSSLWALIASAYGGGAIVAGLALAKFKMRRRMQGILIAGPLWSLPMVFLAIHAPLPLLISGVIVAGIGNALFNVNWASLLQERIPSGRYAVVISLVSFGPMALAPLGLYLGGTILTTDGHVVALALGASWQILSSLALILVPDIRRIASSENAKQGILS